MLHVYLAALGFGGTLVLASLLLGDRDADASADVDADVDVDVDADADAGGADVHVDGHDGGHGHDHDLAGATAGGAWLLLRSFRFWTFVLAFGGAVGAVLTVTGAASAPLIGMAAGGVGMASGATSVWLVRAVRRGSASSDIDESALAGATAKVVVAVAPGSVGKVRLDAKGRVIDVLAETDDDTALPIGAEVLIVSGSHDGRVMVTRNPE